MITLAVGFDGLNALAGVPGKDLIEALRDLQYLLCLDLYISALTLAAAGGLVDHYLRIRQGNTLALCTGREEERAHRGRKADTYRGHIGLDILHSVIYREACGNAAAGAVDIKLYVLIGILRFKIQKLRDDQARGGVVDFLGKHDDAVVEKS